MLQKSQKSATKRIFLGKTKSPTYRTSVFFPDTPTQIETKLM